MGQGPTSQHGSHEARKLVTVLFSDLEGSTALGELLDIEVLRALLLEYFDAMAEVVERWGGAVEKYIGDAVVAVFGVPTTHEDDASRALRAGLEMQERLAEMNPLLRERYGTELSMRVAINTGEVLATTDAAGIVGGDVFNVAARLEGLAEPGTVVIGERTHHVTEGSFEFESLGEVTLKGKTGSRAAWRVLEQRSEVERPLETGLVGREAELGMLEALMAQVIDAHRPRLATVVGETGIGKSRLVREFVSQRTDGIRTLSGRCLPYGKGITFWPLRELLWEASDIALDDSAESAGLKLRSLVDSLPPESVPDPEWLAFALATTAGISLQDNPFERLSPESAGDELQLAWPAFASALASDQPTILVIEDIHWAERPLLDMIEQLALRALGPLLIVATTRPELMEQAPGWGARAIPSQISLGPLTDASFDRMAAQLLPDLDDERRHEILDPAGGNPFFAEEIARHVLAKTSGSRSGGIFVPDSARLVLEARIDQLDAEDREVLQQASVVGEIFWPEPIALLGHGDVNASLSTLEQSGFVSTRPTTSIPTQRELAFRHGLLREAAYQSIPRRRLATMHAAVAEWTESLAADRREEFIEVLAHHYSSAAQPETADLAWREDPDRREHIRVKACVALVEAGEAARRRFSIDQAVDYADRALHLAATDRERLKTLELKASSFHAAARVDESWPVYLQAIAAARQVGDPTAISRVTREATLLWARYGGAFTAVDWKPQAVAVVQERLAEIGENEETLELAALLTGRSTWGRRALFDRTFEEAKTDAWRAMEISENLGSERLLSYALDAYEMVLREEGLCGMGDLADRMVELSSKMLDRRQGHEMMITSAVALSEIGRYAESFQVGETAYVDAQDMGLHLRIHGIRALTAHMIPNGMFPQIIDVSADLLEMITRDGGTICDFGGGAVAGRALAMFEQNRTNEAAQVVDFYEKALPEVNTVRFDHLRLVELVRPFVTLEEAQRLLEKVKELSAPAHHIYAIRSSLPIAVLSGEWSEAEKLAHQARELATSCCAPRMKALADWAEAVRKGSVESAQFALRALDEPYTAARLAVDFLGSVPASEAGDLRRATEQTLTSMGADASLAELRGL